MKKTPVITAFLLILTLPAAAAMFDFYLPWDDDTVNSTGLAHLNHKPAGVSGYVTAGTDGHLYVNSGTDRIKFFGVNITSKSCFPTHANAEKIAKRLAKFGVNIVRWHLMDADFSGTGADSIIDYTAGNSRSLNSANLDSLDYFIYCLKQEGIYSNINLLAGRDFQAADGLPASIDTMDWKDKQTPAMFNPAMIDLQMEFAAQLITHINPYTGLSYANDPAVVFIEVCNEHGLLHAWHSGQIDSMTSDFKTILQDMWNPFLAAKYTNHANLSAAWLLSEPLGSEMLINGDFAAGTTSGWQFQQFAPAAGSVVITPDGHSAGINSADITVSSTSSENWHIQFYQQNLNMSAGHPYTVSFSAKADHATSVILLMEMAADPWAPLGFQQELNLTTSWQRFEFTFQVNQDYTNARLNFREMADETGTYSIADVSLAQGGSLGLKPGEDLDAGTIEVFGVSDKGFRNETAQKDWVEFLWDKEYAYWSIMNDYIKNTLNAHALTIGTVVGNSTPNLMNIFDVIDSHAYFEHPHQPAGWGGPWWVNNRSMVGDNDGATIGGLGMKRLYGKPFGVTEYNHPFPNTFESEAYLFLASYAAFQDWDAVYPYTYDDGTKSWDINKQNGFFEYDRNPGKIMSFIPAANMFRRGDIAAGSSLVRVAMNAADEKNMLHTMGSWRLIDAEHMGMDYETPLMYKCAVIPEGASDPGGLTPSDVTVPGTYNYTSETNELNWNTAGEVYTIDSAKTKGVLGYSMGNNYSLSGIEIRPLSAMQNWASIMMTLMKGASLASGAESILITAHGLQGNTGEVIRSYPDYTALPYPPPAGVDITFQSTADWGAEPTRAEGVECEFVIPYAPNMIKVYALDSIGNTKTSIPIQDESGNAKFIINDTYETLWYEVQVYTTPPPTDTYTPSPTFTITPGGPSNTPTFTITLTPTVAEVLIDDCEDMNNQNNLGGWWYDYCDPLSTVTPDPSGAFTMTSGGYNSSYAAMYAGTIAPVVTPTPSGTAMDPYAGMGTGFNADAGSPNCIKTDISGYTGIRFWTKGDGGQYVVKLAYEDAECASLTGYDDYSYTFTAPAGWALITVPFTEMTQAGRGTAVNLMDVLQNASQLQWQAVGTDRTFELWIDAPSFYNTAGPAESPTPTATGPLFTATTTPAFVATPTQTATVYQLSATCTYTATITVTPVKTAKDTLDNLYIYPSLFDMSNDIKGMYFLNLTKETVIRIFNVKGEMVLRKRIDSPRGEYYLVFEDKRKGRQLTPGIYIYIVTNKAGEVKKGKFAIIR